MYLCERNAVKHRRLHDTDDVADEDRLYDVVDRGVAAHGGGRVGLDQPHLMQQGPPSAGFSSHPTNHNKSIYLYQNIATTIMHNMDSDVTDEHQ